MQKADLFAYLTAFVTIVLAIALTDMIQSTHRLLRRRAQVKWDILTPLLALVVLLWILSEFFGLWLDARFDRITYYGLAGLMAVPVITALAAYAVLPDDVPAKGLDLAQFYWNNRRYIAVLLALMHLGDLGRILHYAYRYNRFASGEPWIQVIAIFGIAFACLAVMYFGRRRWTQLAAILTLLVVAHFGYSAASIDALPA